MARTLYKYTSAKFIDSVLSGGGMLKLSSPSSFNDPNDCYFGISDENLKRSYRMLMNVAFICEYKNDPRYAKSKSFKKAYELTRKSVYVSQVYDENPAINIIIKQYLKTRKQLSDYFNRYKNQFDETYTKIIETLRERSLIGSLTKDNLNMLMWSHYADKHEGICVEYEFEDENGLLDVVYSDDTNTFDLYTVLRYIIPAQYFGVKTTNEMDQECLDACYLPFLRKTKEWSYEHEVRMIFNLNNNSKIINKNGIWFYPNAKVKSIYIGCKVTKENRELIENKCKILNIPVHHISIKKGNNKLHLDD